MPDIFLIGDSHAKILRNAVDQMGLNCAGGFLAPGRHMNDYFFRIRREKFQLLNTAAKWSALASRHLDEFLREANADNLLSLERPILSTIGFNTHNFAASFLRDGLKIDSEAEGSFVSRACFEGVQTSLRTTT